MKNKKYISVIAVIVVLAIGICWITSSRLLGNISGDYTETTTLNSEVSFSANVGDRIKFSFRSEVQGGSLDIVLYSSDGAEIYKLDKARELETFTILNKSDTYTLVSTCNNFVGNFKVKVSTARRLDSFFLNLLD